MHTRFGMANSETEAGVDPIKVNERSAPIDQSELADAPCSVIDPSPSDRLKGMRSTPPHFDCRQLCPNPLLGAPSPARVANVNRQCRNSSLAPSIPVGVMSTLRTLARAI